MCLVIILNKDRKLTNIRASLIQNSDIYVEVDTFDLESVVCKENQSAANCMVVSY